MYSDRKKTPRTKTSRFDDTLPRYKCVVKIPVDSEEENCLFDQMHHLAADEVLRRELGHRACEYVLTKHSPPLTARSYIAAIGRILSPYSMSHEENDPALWSEVAANLPSTTIRPDGVRGILQREVAAALGEIGIS